MSPRIVPVLALTAALVACQTPSGAPSSGRIDSAAAHALVEKGAKLIDVRTPEEFADGHIPGAVNVPLDQLGQRLEAIGPKDAAGVVYCRSGGRSAAAARRLRGLGYTAVNDLGGMSAW